MKVVWTVFYTVILLCNYSGATNFWHAEIPQYFGTLLNTNETNDEVLNGVSSQCRDQIADFFFTFNNSSKSGDTLQSYLKLLLDSWGNPTNLSNSDWRNAGIGKYHKCLGDKVINHNKLVSFSGKYCLSIVGFNNQERNESLKPGEVNDIESSFLFGTCVPSTCSKEDVFVLAQNALGATNSTKIEFRVLDCVTNAEQTLQGWDIFLMCILGLLLLMSIASVLWDCRNVKGKQSFGSRCLATFSPKRNVVLWLKGDEFEFAPAMNGLLFLTVAWIILANSWRLPFLWNYFPELVSLMNHSDWSQLLISNAHLAMDTLLTISGITIAFNVMKELDNFDGKVGPYIYVQIFLRLTPSYFLVVGFMATVFRFLGDGPLSSLIHQASTNCASNGWKNILYANNFISATLENMCIPDSWYFAVEMQFLVFAPILTYTLWKFQKIGLGILTFLILGSIVVPAVLTWERNILPAAIPTRNYESYFAEFNILPWNRASPFLVGMFTGYFLSITGKRCKLPKPFVLIGWIMSTVVALAIIFGLFPYYNPKIKIPTVEAAVYAGFHRFAWGVVIAWIVFACSRGFGGWINSFLAWNFFQPLGSISMVAFLVALPVQFVHHFRIQPVLLPDTYTKVNLFVADLVISYIMAVLLTLILGGPFQQLGNFLKPRKKEDDDLDSLEMKAKVERYGIYYNTEISPCMRKSKGSRRKPPSDIVTVYPRRQRYGIYYDNDVSISMERIK